MLHSTGFALPGVGTRICTQVCGLTHWNSRMVPEMVTGCSRSNMEKEWCARLCTATASANNQRRRKRNNARRQLQNLTNASGNVLNGIPASHSLRRREETCIDFQQALSGLTENRSNAHGACLTGLEHTQTFAISRLRCALQRWNHEQVDQRGGQQATDDDHRHGMLDLMAWSIA